MRTVLISGALLGCLLGSGVNPVRATTLQQLSLDQMIRNSTEIVRGKVQCTGSSLHGSILYTNYRVQVSEEWKGASAGQLDIAVPGGFSNGIRQTYAGAPALVDGQEFVLFLWTSKSGLRQIIGLSQGMFNLSQLGNGVLMAGRSASADQMVDASGSPTHDTSLTMPLNELRSKVASTLGSRSSQ